MSRRSCEKCEFSSLFTVLMWPISIVWLSNFFPVERSKIFPSKVLNEKLISHFKTCQFWHSNSFWQLKFLFYIPASKRKIFRHFSRIKKNKKSYEFFIRIFSSIWFLTSLKEDNKYLLKVLYFILVL